MGRAGLLRTLHPELVQLPSVLLPPAVRSLGLRDPGGAAVQLRTGTARRAGGHAWGPLREKRETQAARHNPCLASSRPAGWLLPSVCADQSAQAPELRGRPEGPSRPTSDRVKSSLWKSSSQSIVRETNASPWIVHGYPAVAYPRGAEEKKGFAGSGWAAWLC